MKIISEDTTIEGIAKSNHAVEGEQQLCPMCLLHVKLCTPQYLENHCWNHRKCWFRM